MLNCLKCYRHGMEKWGEDVKEDNDSRRIKEHEEKFSWNEEDLWN